MHPPENGNAGPVYQTGRGAVTYSAADPHPIPHVAHGRHPGETDTYPNQPGWRKTDTSREAADIIAPKAPILQDQCLDILRSRAATSDEIADVIGRPYMSVRPRLTELQAKGMVIDSGQRRRNARGVRTVVWRLATAEDTRADFARVDGGANDAAPYRSYRGRSHRTAGPRTAPDPGREDDCRALRLTGDLGEGRHQCRRHRGCGMMPTVEILCFTPPPTITVLAAKIMLNTAIKTLVTAAIRHEDMAAWDLAKRHIEISAYIDQEPAA